MGRPRKKSNCKVPGSWPLTGSSSTGPIQACCAAQNQTQACSLPAPLTAAFAQIPGFLPPPSSFASWTGQGRAGLHWQARLSLSLEENAFLLAPEKRAEGGCGCVPCLAAWLPAWEQDLGRLRKGHISAKGRLQLMCREVIVKPVCSFFPV